MAETKTFLILANRLGYIEESLKENYVNRLSELGKMLNGYITHLRKQKSVRSAQEIPDKEQAYSE